jgi:pimeloyl-ACP methyl ester carboxylesterase
MKLVAKIFAGLVIFFLILGGVGCATMHRADIPYPTLQERYAHPESRFVQLPNGVRMHVRDVGPPTAPTLLMVHGFGASTHTWDAWTQRFAGEYRVISLDLVGHGLTEAPEGYQISIESFAADIEAFAAQQGLARFVIIGSSMGGHTALTYALTNPARVQGLVLVGSAGFAPDGVDRGRPFLFTVVGWPVIGPILRDLDNTAFARRTLEAAFVDQTFVTEEMVTRYTDLSRAPGHRPLVVDLITSAYERPYATAETLAPLAAIPTLILHGEQDNLVPVDFGRLFHEAIPGSELVIWPEVGHIPQEEIAQVSGEALASWLRLRAFPPEQTAIPAAVP